jgi:hypothetical protein
MGGSSGGNGGVEDICPGSMPSRVSAETSSTLQICYIVSMLGHLRVFS